MSQIHIHPKFSYCGELADINECESGDDNCNNNANCTNSDGSFYCACNLGYSGDGVNCTGDIIVLMRSFVIYPFDM